MNEGHIAALSNNKKIEVADFVRREGLNKLWCS